MVCQKERFLEKYRLTLIACVLAHVLICVLNHVSFLVFLSAIPVNSARKTDFLRINLFSFGMLELSRFLKHFAQKFSVLLYVARGQALNARRWPTTQRRSCSMARERQATNCLRERITTMVSKWKVSRELVEMTYSTCTRVYLTHSRRVCLVWYVSL